MLRPGAPLPVSDRPRPPAIPEPLRLLGSAVLLTAIQDWFEPPFMPGLDYRRAREEAGRFLFDRGGEWAAAREIWLEVAGLDESHLADLLRTGACRELRRRVAETLPAFVMHRAVRRVTWDEILGETRPEPHDLVNKLRPIPG